MKLTPDILKNATRDGRNAHLLRVVSEPIESRIPMSEYQEQCALIEMCELNSAMIPELAWIFAVPNGEHRKKSVAARLKKQGVKPGVCDLILLVPRKGFYGLLIEMKTATGQASVEQTEWLRHHSELGYSVWMCRSHKEAWNVLMDYLER